MTCKFLLIISIIIVGDDIEDENESDELDLT